MKIGVVSDSHGHIENLRRALRALLERGIQVFCHLGDDYEDMRALEAGTLAVVQVPGVFSSYYRDPAVPNRVLRSWGGKRFLLTHTKVRHENDLRGDPDPRELVAKGEVDGILYGHSHTPEVLAEQGVLFLNPGHLKDEDKKGYPPTYGLVEVKGEALSGMVYDLYSGEVLFSHTLGGAR